MAELVFRVKSGNVGAVVEAALDNNVIARDEINLDSMEDRQRFAEDVHAKVPAATVELIRRELLSIDPLGLPESDDWLEPHPLPSPLPEVETYSDSLLPTAIGGAVRDIAERMQCPPDFAAASMLVAMASVIGCRVGIRPRQHDDWLVVPNLWGCVVGRPSLKKSPSIAHAEKRVRALETRERERLAEEIHQYQVGAILCDAKAKAAKQAIEKALKAGDQTLAEELAQELLQAGEAGSPVPRRIITSDATIEKIGEMLNRHPAGLCLWVDELVGWMRGLDRENMAGVRQQFLTMWNGQGRLNIDRVVRGEIVVDSPCLSLFGCATPGGIAEYVASCMRGGRGDDGLLQRLQILVWPDAPKEFVHIDRWPDSEVHRALVTVFESLWDLEPNSFAQRDQFDDGTGIPWVRFEPAGQAVFDAWEIALQTRIRSEELPEAFESHLAKYASLVPTIALILDLASGHRGAVKQCSVSMAVAWAEYLESHAARLYSIAATPARRCAQPLLKRLFHWPEDVPIRARSISKKGWSGLSDSKSVEDALELLVETGWLRSLPSKSDVGGRPTVDYELHPKAQKFFERFQSVTPKTGESPGGGGFGGFGGSDSKGCEKIESTSERITGVL